MQKEDEYWSEITVHFDEFIDSFIKCYEEKFGDTKDIKELKELFGYTDGKSEK